MVYSSPLIGGDVQMDFGEIRSHIMASGGTITSPTALKVPGNERFRSRAFTCCAGLHQKLSERKVTIVWRWQVNRKFWWILIRFSLKSEILVYDQYLPKQI